MLIRVDPIRLRPLRRSLRDELGHYGAARTMNSATCTLRGG